MFSTSGQQTSAQYGVEGGSAQVWKPPFSRHTGVLGAFLALSLQFSAQVYANPVQPVFDAPSGATPRVPPLVQIPPQQFDYTLQPFVETPQNGTTPQGCVPGNQSSFGLHAAALYNAEAQKSQIWGSLVGAPALVKSWAGIGAQAIDFSLQPFFDAPVKGALPRSATTLVTGPQNVDLSLQPFFDIAPTAPVAASRVAAFVSDRLQRLDPTTQPFLDAPVIGTPPSGAVPSNQSTFGAHAATLYNAEAQKVFFDAPVVGTGGGVTGKLGQWVNGNGSHRYDLTLQQPQPFFDVPQLNPSGWLLTTVCAAPDLTEYPTLQASFTRAAIQGPSTGILGAFAKIPAQVDLTQQPFFDAPQLAGAAPRIVPSLWTPEQSYFNPAPSFTRPSVPLGGPAIGIVFEIPQQTYTDAQPRIFAPSIAGKPPAAAVFFSLWPIDPTQLPAFFDAPMPGQPPPTGRVPAAVQLAGQAFDYALQPFFDAPLVRPLTGWIAPSVSVVAQWTDPPQPQIVRASMALLRGPVPPLLQAAPQLADLNLQPNFTRPLITGQGNLGSFALAPPQQFDYTLQGIYRAPVSAAIAYTAKGPIVLTLDDYGRLLPLNDYGGRLTL